MEFSNMVATTGVYADGMNGSENGFGSVVKKIKNIFCCQDLERTSLLPGLARDLRPGKRWRPNVDRLRLSGTRAIMSPAPAAWTL